MTIIYNDSGHVLQFMDWINNVDPALKFFHQLDTKYVNFFDTTVYVTLEQTLAVKVYHKPMDRNSLLHFKSFHPHSLMNNLP